MTSLDDKARAAKNFSFLVSESNVSGDLKLDDMELSSIPSEIWKMGQLIKCISMQRNQISIVPESFFDLNSIQRLCLDHNLIKRFPDELGNICYLQHMSADFNMIQCLPHTVGLLTNLKVLRLAENCISALPLELGCCEKITTLDITGNPTTFPPKEVCARGSSAICKFLKTFSSATSSGVLRFKSIPMEVLPIEVMQIPRLKRLDLLGSMVKVIPVFCAGLASSLQKIDVAPEQLSFPHPSIMASGTEATLKYLQDILDGINKSQVRSSGTYGEISLVGMFLPEVPPQVLVATALTKLNISQNSIREVTGLHGDIYLKHFMAQQNQLQAIPHDVLRSTKVLVTINMNQNYLTQFPQSVLLCPMLQTLCIGGNEINSLPDNIVLLQSTLTHLDVSNALCKNVSIVAALTKLKHLNVSGNRLLNMPMLFSNLGNLQTLISEDNGHTFVDYCLQRMTNLTRLSLAKNPIVVLAPYIGDLIHLVNFDASQTQIRVLAPQCFKWSKLKTLNLSGSPCYCPPKCYHHDVLKAMTILSQISEAFANDEFRLVHEQILDFPGTVCFIAETTKLVLVDLGISHIPSELGLMKKLRHLDLSSNRIEEITASVGDCISLMLFDVRRNPIRFIHVHAARVSIKDFFMDPTETEMPPPEVGMRDDSNQIWSFMRGCYNSTEENFFVASNVGISYLPDEIVRNGQKWWMVNLSHNNLKTVPSNLVMSKMLNTLIVSDNPMESLPDWLNGFKFLRDFRCSGIPFQKFPRVLTQLTTLTRLEMGRCCLNEAPADLVGLTALVDLRMDQNQLSVLPGRIGQLVLLTHLLLSSNKLRSLPESIGNLSNLICLAIDDNNFISIPLQVGRLTSLQMLMIQKNPLRSPPDTVIRQGSQAIIDFCKSIQESTGFKVINLNKKGLSILPSEVVELRGISELKLGENSIKEIDGDLSCWDGIKSIDLHGNLLQFVPKSFEVLTSLTALMLHGNSIRELPSWLGMLPNLMKLTFDRILISQPCQDIIRQDTVRVIEYLRSLHLAKQTQHLAIIKLGLSTIPSEILILTSLTFLNLEANRIAAISERVGNFHHLKILSLRGNRLSMLPDSFINLTNLVELNISENIINVLQKQVVLLPQISIIDCSCNKLKTIAPTIKYCTTLTQLIIHHNMLWTIPYAEMLFCKSLVYLDLDHNVFAEIDPGIMHFTTIRSLKLAGNPLQSLPIQFVLLSNITVLDLTGCPLVCPPPSVVAAGKELSREFLNRIVTGIKYGTCDLSELEVENGETGLQIYRDSIGTLLTELNVAACGFKILDDSFISIFQVLSDLTLTENSLVQLPDNFVKYLSTLQLLRLDCNQLESISNNDWSLVVGLTILDLTSNKLRELPDSLGLCLKLLNCFVTQNPILQIPQSFSSLQNLEIFECDVDNLTDIQNLSAAIQWQQYGAPPLTVLIRGSRALARYYEMVHVASSGVSLDLSGIRMSAIPSAVYSFKWIKLLDLSKNLIKSIPPSLKKLENLAELDLRSNPIAYLSPVVIELEHLANFNISSSCFFSIQNMPIPIFLDSLLGIQNEGQAMNLFIRSLMLALAQTQRIDISGWGLLALNSNWTDFGRLTCLDASNNCLGCLPSGISILTNLIVLSLSLNFFEVIPDVLCEIVSLKTALFNLNPVAMISTISVSNTVLEHLSLTWFEFSPFPLELELSGGLLKFLRAVNSGNVLALPSCGLSSFNLVTMPQSMILSAMTLIETPQSAKYTALASKKWQEAKHKISKMLGPFGSKILKSDSSPEVVHAGKLSNSYFDSLRTFLSAYDADEKILVWARPELYAKIQIDTKPKKWYQFSTTSSKNTQNQLEEELASDSSLRTTPLYVMLNPMCSATNLKELSLHGNSFEFIDNILKEVTSVVDMKITHCCVHALSENTKLLTLLETMNLSHNEIVFLPEQLGRCLALTDLNLSHNQLRRLPVSIGRLKNVVNIRLDHNNLSYLTPEIGGVPEVYGMTGWINCKNLNLSHNPLTLLVPTLCGLTSLEVLRLKNCDLLQNPPKEILRGGICHIWKYLQQFRDGLSEAIPSVRLSGWGLESIPNCWHIYGDVQALDLADNLISKLENFHMLSDLTSLKLSGNPIGVLEPFMANFSKMKVLLLENINCQFFPAEILNLVELTSLKLDFNPKLNRVPKRIRNLSQIETLCLSNCSLNSVNSLAELWRLKTLNVSKNQITLIPDVFSNLGRLEILDISDNIVEFIHPAMCSCTSLRILDLRNNSIIHLPRNIHHLKRMQDLLASGNPNLSGPPQWVVSQGMPGIRNFYDSLSKAETSLSLEIVNQASCTAVPLDLFHLTTLTALTISCCPIEIMHDDIGVLICLTALEISHCNLKKLPSMLSKCLKLTSINLQGNGISSLPIRWADLTNMNSLSLSENRFELVPPCIQYFIYLSWLDMCDNFLASIPTWLVGLPYLDCLEMGNNAFRLVPALIFELGDRQMISLNLSGNGIESLPAAIATQSGLTSLRITHNRIGSIPAQICTMNFLEILNISQNELTILPANLGDLTNLTELQLHCNQIVQLPLSLKNCNQMKLLTLHENPIRFFPLFVSGWSKLEELWVPDLKQLPPFLVNSTPAVIYTSADETTVRGQGAILRTKAKTVASSFVNLVSQSKSKLRWHKVQGTVADAAQESLTTQQNQIQKLRDERVYFDSDSIILYQHSLTTGIRLHFTCEMFLDTSPRLKIFHQILSLGNSDGGSVMTKEVGIMPLSVVSDDKFIIVIELRKTNTNELLGIGEDCINMLELRKLQGNDFLRKNIRLLGGYPMATVADTNMCIRIQMKEVLTIDATGKLEDDWNTDDFD